MKLVEFLCAAVYSNYRIQTSKRRIDVNNENMQKPSPHWPAGTTVNCKCPHCRHVDVVQISSSREEGYDNRPAECSACYGNYMVVAKDGIVSIEKFEKDQLTLLIHHHYDIGDQGVTVKAPAGFDARRAAVYLLFQAEGWFGHETLVSNLGIAAALVTFYGCKHAATNRFGEVLDLYTEREKRCPEAKELMADASLAREGLREFLRHHVES